MTTPLTDEALTEMEEELKKISPWPWRRKNDFDGFDEFLNEHNVIGKCWGPDPVVYHNVGFIIKSPSRIAALIQEVKRLKKVEEIVPELLEVCKFILSGLETPESSMSECWKVIVEFKLREAIAKAEKLAGET